MIKIEILAQVFSVNFAQILGILFLTEYLRWLWLDVLTCNAWYLPIRMAENVKKYEHIHIRDKNIREINSLTNFQEPQILNNYIKELLVEIKLTLTLTH